MNRSKPTRATRGKAAAASSPPKEFDIPYFAHQQLDPKRYPSGVGNPVGGPPDHYAQLNGEVSAWDSGSEGDAEIDFDETIDPFNIQESMSPPERPTPKKEKQALKRDREPFDSKSYKKLRTEGGRPVIAKKVQYDLDSDDELIVQMKQARYLEKDIADRLAAEGRVAYQPKTIGTRWARIKKVLQDRQDDVLDDELTDWHDGDDEVLMQAIAKADRDIEKAKQQAESKKWKIVSDHMKLVKPVTNFSQNACQARFDGLSDGTAKPTPESLSNPNEKALARIQARRDKEEYIRQMMDQGVDAVRRTLAKNGWTSRMRNI